MSAVSPEPIQRLIEGLLAAKHLFVASEIGVFEALAGGPLPLDALAERLSVPRRTLRMLVDALVALDILDREKDGYTNSALSAAFLSGGPGPDLRPLLRMSDRVTYPQWLRLEEAIREEKRIHGYEDFTPEEQVIFSEGVESFTTGSAFALADVYDFGSHRRLLDLGGGTGSFLLAARQKNPALEMTLFDLPKTAASVREKLAKKPGGEAIRVAEGDLLEGAIPSGHDAILLANVVHLFRPEKNRAVLRRIRAAVAPSARLLLVDFWTDPTHTAPVSAALMALEFQIVTGEGDVYSVAEVSTWLAETGWRVVEHLPLGGSASVIVAEAE